MKTFLKPLTSEEEKYYLQEYKRGSQEAKNVLIERNLRLVAHIVKKYQGVEEELDDLISIGTIGLIKAIHTFNQEKSNRLSTYAARCIDNELLMLLRSKKKTSKDISLYEPIGTDREGNEINLLDVIENEEGIYHKDRRTDIISNREMAYLRQFPNVTMTQHMAFYTIEAVESMVSCGVRNLLEFEKCGSCRLEL